MVNVLKAHLRIVIATLLEGGTPQREIARRTGVDRKTIRRYASALTRIDPPLLVKADPSGRS